jgi:hypothetical protein
MSQQLRRPLTLVLLLSLLCSQLVSASGPAWLTRTRPASPTYAVSYATECPPGEAACTPDELVDPADSNGDGHPDKVEEMAGFLEDSRTAYMTTFGMREPHFSGAPTRPAYMSGGCWGSYNGASMYMCAKGTSLDRVQAKATAVHELFHAAQWAYRMPPQPGWVIEGQAAMVEDAVFNDLDGDPGTFLFSQGSAYLSDPNNFALTSIAYEAAWFWKYFAEQYGTLPNPGQGMDALRIFWERVDAEGVAGIDAVNRTLALIRPGTTFEQVYQNFLVANYARKLSAASLPAIYRFADEAEAAPGPLTAVKLDVSADLGPADQVGPLLSDVRAWGARYYEVRPAADVPILSVNLRQDTANRLYTALLLIKDGRIVSEERAVGRHYSRALPNAAYDRMVLVVGGLENRANYRLTINGTRPILNITDPLAARPARVVTGTGDKFLLKVEALDPGGTPVEGIDPTSFNVTVGTTPLSTTDLVTSAYVQGQYWLLLRAPDLAAGTYPVQVRWASLNDTEAGAIIYGPREIADNVVVLDRSGSMAGAKLIHAKDAARVYIDSWRDGDQIGVVSFNGDATVDLSLRPLGTTSRNDARAAVNSAVAGGATSIGDGAASALDELISRGRPDDLWSIVLLSDGEETAPRSVDEFLAAYNTRRDRGDKVPQVHTIALGADADRALMQRLAAATGGTYQYAAEPGGSLAALGDTLPLDLNEIYRIAVEATDRQQQIYSEQVLLGQQGVVDEFTIAVDGASELYITMAWQSAFSGGDVELYRPDATLVPLANERRDLGHVVWSMRNPAPGNWRVRVDCTGVEFCAEQRLLEAAVRSPLTIDLFLSPTPELRRVGRPIELLVPLTDTAPVRGASVIARIIAPNGSERSVTLYDDGAHGDGAADDGLYGGRYPWTNQLGSYIVRVNAQGSNNAGLNFVRRISRAFDIAADGDKDQDGLPDSWEEANGSDPFKSDAQADPDQDGLINFQEFQLGTNPLDPDSDDGGESDGSEVNNQRDPLDPKDDKVRYSGEIYLEPGNGQITIGYPVLPDYVKFILFRSTNANGPFTMLNDNLPPTGEYTDESAENGTTYYYRLSAVGADGASSPLSDAAEATPRLDPIEPGGSVVIADGAASTNQAEVVLTLLASDDGAQHEPGAAAPDPARARSTSGLQMRISNDPTFSGASWEAYSRSKPWRLAGTSGPNIVYVQFRDAAGNESHSVSDAIILTSGGKVYLPMVVR